jgi:hypothetical protein
LSRNSLRNNVPHLTGNEADLLARYTFAKGQLPSKLARPMTLHGGARRSTTSANRDSATDAALLPQPTRQQPMDLLFPRRGVVGDSGSGRCRGIAQGLCVVLLGLQDGRPTARWLLSHGIRRGTLLRLCAGDGRHDDRERVSGTSNSSNIIEIEQASGEICGYLHLKQNSSIVNDNDHATMGQKLALTGDTGANVGAFHLHLAMTDKPDGTSGFVTFPVGVQRLRDQSRQRHLA